MGSIARGNALDRFIEKYGEEVKQKYESLLLLKTVEEFLETEVNYYVKGLVRLSDGNIVESHFRWASEEEDHEGIELDEDYVQMENYYKDNIVGKVIENVQIGYERDDECYIYAFVDDDHCLEIPIGVDPEGGIDEMGNPVDGDEVLKELNHIILD